MKRLIIAEKPSVAQAIAAVLNIREKKPGYLEGADVLVSWCAGHLVELAAPESYDARYARWRQEDLPIVPGVEHTVQDLNAQMGHADLVDIGEAHTKTYIYII